MGGISGSVRIQTQGIDYLHGTKEMVILDYIGNQTTRCIFKNDAHVM